MIRDDSADFARSAMALMQMMFAMGQQQKQMRSEQAGNLIATKPAGSTVQQIGLTPAQQKARFGKIMGQTDVITPATAESQTEKLMMERVQSLSPEQVDMFTASLLAKQFGTPAVTTMGALGTRAKTSEVTAGAEAVQAKTEAARADTTQALVLKGLQAISAAPEEVKANLGARIAVGTTPMESEAADLDAKIKTEAKRSALAMLANKDHPLNRVMKANLGFNAIEALPGIGLGMTSLMDETARIAYEKVSTSRAMDVARFQASMDMEKAMNDAEARWSEAVGKEVGGAFTPRAVLNWKRWREAGGDPKKMPTGVSDVMDAQLSTATANGMNAYVTQQAEKGDPVAQQLQKLMEGMQRITDPRAQAVFGELSNNYFARVAVNKANGPRPSDPKAAAAWDQAVKVEQGKLVKLDTKWWLGFHPKLVQPDMTAPQKLTSPPGFPPVTPPAGVVPQPPGGTPPVSLAPTTPSGVSEQDALAIQQLVDSILAFSAKQRTKPKP